MSEIRHAVGAALGTSGKFRSIDSCLSTSLRWGARCALAVSLLGMSGLAAAQEQQDEQAALDDGFVLEEITVTGTRIRQTGDYASPTPLMSIDAEQMQNLGLVNVGDAMVQTPANVSQIQPGNVGGTAFFVGSTLANLRGLNPFFGTRTLTLVDSRRHVPTNQGGGVDLNFIPSILISRMEVVTGGASAAYGSEAISGVVNVILDKEFEGLKFESDYGGTTHGDGANWHIGAAGGTSLFDGRGHLVVGGEFQTSDAIQSCADARDWCARSVGFFTNGGGFTVGEPYTNPRIPGQPHSIIMSNLRRNQESYTGVIFNNTEGAAVAQQFNEAGTGLTPFNIGEYGWTNPGGEAIGGDGLPIYTNLTLYPEVERASTFAHFNYDITDNLNAFLEASWGQVKAVNRQEAPANNSVNLCISADNAFIAGNPELQAAILAAQGNGVASFVCSPTETVVTKNFAADIDQRVNTDTSTWRVALGLQGRLTDTWTWDAYYQYGSTERDQIASDYRTNFRFRMAVDSVIDDRPGSPTFGQPICRVTRDGLAALPVGADPSLAVGCVPLNPFGVGNISPQARAYAFGSLTEYNEIEQHVVAFNLTGELWEGIGAGPLMAATGAEHRRESMDNLSGDLPFAQRTDFALQYGDPFGGDTQVTEAYVELEMPFLRDAPLAKLLMLNGAVRHASYETEGGIGTDGSKGSHDILSWKLAGVWDPVDWLRVRGSRSRDLRAAGFRELFYSQAVPPGAFFCLLTNPWLPDTGPFSQCANDAALILSGNPQLKPEEADTTTIGLVFTPGGWARGLRFSADYYEIDLKDGIALGNAQEVIRLCYEENVQEECDRITFGEPTDPTNPRSNIIAVRGPYRNMLPYKATGIDFAADYFLPLNKVFTDATGGLAFRLTATRALETLVQSGNAVRDIAGQTGGDSGFGGFSDFAAAPDWSANLVISYLGGPLTLTTQVRYTSDGVLDKQMPKTGPDEPGYDPSLVGSVSDNTVPSYAVVNLSGSYDFKWFGLEKFQVWASLNNVFDKEPPFSQGFVGGANPIYFDTLGRTYRVGMRVNF